MSSHSDTIIGLEVLARACGCRQDFAHYNRDPYRKERREKFCRTRCPPCGAKANAEHNARQEAARPAGKARSGKKGCVLKRIPRGAVIEMTRDEDSGEWYGSLSINGLIAAEASGGSVIGLVSALARKWLAANGQAKD